MTYVIQNGTIIDGTQRAAFKGDVILERGKIAAVVKAEEAPKTYSNAECILDVTGLLVTPGFIDAHTHSDAYLMIEPDAPSKLAQGITTGINGQCGGSAAPRFGEARLSSDWASILGNRLTWHSVAEYREKFAAVRPSINTVQFIGHNTLRSSVVGYEGRASTPDEMRRMIKMLEASLDEGGWGLTTGLIYQPGKYATQEEVVTLAKTAAAKGGFYATHMRSEGDQLLESIDEVIDLVKATGIRAEISHLKTSGRANWHKVDAALEKIEKAMNAGLLLGSDRYPYCAAGTDLDVVFPDWAGEGAAKAECVRLADPVIRQRIIDEINASGRDWSSVMIGGTWHEETKQFSGKRVSDCFAPFGTPGAFICELLAKDLCRTGAFFFGMSEANLDKILSKPWIVPGSDASLRAPWGPLGADHPHPRAYGTMPEFYRRVRMLGVSREEAIARMTSVIAERFEIPNRGKIAAGAAADLAVWDEATFASKATYLEPHQFATGMRAVFVNGALAYEEGRFTHAGTGQFLTRN